jgi:hypothetical protein
MIDLFAAHILLDPLEPWRPRALGHDEWPAPYERVYAWRIRQLDLLRSDPAMLSSAKRYYSTHPAEFIMHWMDTFDPRTETKWMPFVFFKRQLEFVQFLHELRTTQQSGLVEKCRDAGATWVACAYSVWSFLFIPNDAIGWGSRKETLVDKLGDADSIFEKMRLMLSRMPDVWKPAGWNPRTHASYMKLINPENGSSVSGEAGDNIGRGGRKAAYFKDEAQPLDARIATPFGWTTMGEIRIGDYITGRDGKPTRVVGINDCGQHETYRVELSDRSSTVCSVNHNWTVYKRGKLMTLPLSEIMKDYLYNSPGGQTQYPYKIPTNDPVEYFVTSKLPLDPYVLGILLGDGSVGGVPNDSPNFTTVDMEIVGYVALSLPKGVVVRRDVKKGITYRLVDERGGLGNKSDKKSRARQAVLKSGIAGCRSWEKFIPQIYMRSSIADRHALLQGLMDSDGSAANGGMPTFHTASEKLCNDVKELVRSLGGSVSHTVKRDHRGFRDQYCLYINMPDQFPPFRLGRKLAAMKTRTRTNLKSIKSITPMGLQTVRCITVENEDGLYLTDDFIVTHNSAHYPRPELIEAALGDNTNVQVDISSVNGLGNVFHRRRESGQEWYPGHDIPRGTVRVFVIDWRDHPAKTQEWYDQRKAKFTAEGMAHVFAQEVDRDYSSAVSNTIISLEWINAAVDAHLTIPWLASETPPDVWGAGLDVADEGMDRNALALRQWIIVRDVEEWGERDVGITCRRTIRALRETARSPSIVKVQYDCVGMGSSVKAEYNRWVDEGLLNPQEIKFVPWNAGNKVIYPFERVVPDDELSPTNKAMFANFKAQAWWSLRTRFYKTWRAVTEGIVYPAEELISLDSRMALLQQLKKELATPTRGDSASLQMVVNKKPNGNKSPNLADAVVQCMFPALDDSGIMAVSNYG